ncbi:MAG: hypothetical protein O3C55_04840 [Proteobacteria bacterium]|nr:hypothetical protein [Pseudomonadota bacterium]
MDWITALYFDDTEDNQCVDCEVDIQKFVAYSKLSIVDLIVNAQAEESDNWFVLQQKIEDFIFGKINDIAKQYYDLSVNFESIHYNYCAMTEIDKLDSSIDTIEDLKNNLVFLKLRTQRPQ